MTLDARLDRLREAVEAIGLEMGLRSLKDRGAREEALRLIEELRLEILVMRLVQNSPIR